MNQYKSGIAFTPNSVYGDTSRVRVRPVPVTCHLYRPLRTVRIRSLILSLSSLHRPSANVFGILFVAGVKRTAT